MSHNTSLFYQTVDSFSDLIKVSVFISSDRFKAFPLSFFFTIKKLCLHSKVIDVAVAWDF